MQNKPILRALITTLAATVLVAACGGGNGDGPTTASSGKVSNTVTVANPALGGGSSTAVTASAYVQGDTPTSMKWSITPLTPSSGAVPTFSDPNCTAATLTAPAVAGTSGAGACNAILTIPPTAITGNWRVTNTVTSASGSISSSQDVVVTALPESGFRLMESSTPIVAYVNKTVQLSLPFTINLGNVSNVRYTWAAAATNPAVVPIGGISSSTASFTPTTTGQYQFMATVNALVDGIPQTTTGSVIVQVSPPNQAASLVVSPPQTVAPGAVVTLSGSVANSDKTLSYSNEWVQQPGAMPSVTLTNATSTTSSTTASFIAPTTEGTYRFTWTVITTFLDGTTATANASTTIIVKANATGSFNVSAGNAQSVAPGAAVMLNGNVTGQGATSYSYAWQQVGSTPATITLSNPNSATASFIAPTTSGTYNFLLTVLTGSTSVSSTTQVVVK